MADYYEAAICRRGHVYTSSAHLMPPADRCTTCGAKILTACPGCETPIRGRLFVPGVVGVSNYASPDFCFKCGSPFPWVSRQARVWELQNLLDDEDLDEADRLTVSEQLIALQDPDLADEEQVERWTRIRKLSPGLMASGQRIIEGVVTATVKAQLGL